MQFVLEFGAWPLSMAKAIWRSSTLEASYALFPCLSSGQALLIPPLAEDPPPFVPPPLLRPTSYPGSSSLTG